LRTTDCSSVTVTVIFATFVSFLVRLGSEVIPVEPV
jgi:hypothetical protein